MAGLNEISSADVGQNTISTRYNTNRYPTFDYQTEHERGATAPPRPDTETTPPPASGGGGGSSGPSGPSAGDLAAGLGALGLIKAGPDLFNAGSTAVNEFGNLATAGNGNPLAAVTESVKNIGQNTWADPLAGPRTTAKMPTGGTNTLAGAGYTGSVGTATALGTDVGSGMYMGTDGLVTDLTGMSSTNVGQSALSTVSATQPAAAVAVPGPGVLGEAGISVGGASAGSLLTGLGLAGAMWGGMEFLQNMKNFKGGSAEGAKSAKFAEQLRKDIQADPSGRKAQQTLQQLVNGGFWAGEGNGWVVAELMQKGVLGFDNPMLYTGNSKFNPFGSNDTKTDATALGKAVEYMSYGLSAADADKLARLQGKLGSAEKAYTEQRNSSDAGVMRQHTPSAENVYTPQERTWMTQMQARLTPQARLNTAITLRSRILAQNPQADVTKLNEFIRTNRAAPARR